MSRFPGRLIAHLEIVIVVLISPRPHFQVKLDIIDWWADINLGLVSLYVRTHQLAFYHHLVVKEACVD